MIFFTIWVSFGGRNLGTIFFFQKRSVNIDFHVVYQQLHTCPLIFNTHVRFWKYPDSMREYSRISNLATGYQTERFHHRDLGESESGHSHIKYTYTYIRASRATVKTRERVCRLYLARRFRSSFRLISAANYPHYAYICMYILSHCGAMISHCMIQRRVIKTHSSSSSKSNRAKFQFSIPRSLHASMVHGNRVFFPSYTRRQKLTIIFRLKCSKILNGLFLIWFIRKIFLNCYIYSKIFDMK